MVDDERAFDLRERQVGGTSVVEISGELDIEAAARTSARLDTLTSRERPDLVLDLRAVMFIDCSGLSVLIRARGRALGRGGRLALVCDGPRVPRLLRLTGLTRAFAVHTDLASALAAPWREEPPATDGAIA
jgi:anti-anti-sigma factor